MVEAVVEDTSLLITAWLSSFATSRLRACSRSCASLFRRHCPPSTTEFLYVETAEPQSHASLVPVAPRNPHSPLRCWRFALASVRAAQSLAIDERGGKRFLAAVLSQSRGHMLAIVAQNGAALRHADESLKGDRDVVLAAVAQNGRAFAAAATRAHDREVLATVVAHAGWAFEYANEALKRDRDVVGAVVARCGWALRHAHPSLKGDRDLVTRAVTHSGLALAFAADALKRDRDIVLAAVTQNGLALKDASLWLRADRGVVLAAVRQDGRALRYASWWFKRDADVVLAAVLASGHVALDFASAWLPQRDRDNILHIARTTKAAARGLPPREDSFL